MKKILLLFYLGMTSKLKYDTLPDFSPVSQFSQMTISFCQNLSRDLISMRIDKRIFWHWTVLFQLNQSA